MKTMLEEVIDAHDVAKAHGVIPGFGYHSPAWDSLWRLSGIYAEAIIKRITENAS